MRVCLRNHCSNAYISDCIGGLWHMILGMVQVSSSKSIPMLPRHHPFKRVAVSAASFFLFC